MLAYAYPSEAILTYAEGTNNFGGNIRMPERARDTGPKGIPDKKHPYRAPREKDQRGPCPGLNTLANHGYLPRDGVASFAEIVEAVQEGYNMDYVLGAGIAAFAMLTRGNVLLDRLSIGGETKKVPRLPNDLDGTPGGLAAHGRFEGDVSFSRHDHALGDSRHFQQDLFDQMLATQKKFGNGTDIVTADALRQMKKDRFEDSLLRNPAFEFHAVRETFSFGEAAFTYRLFANGSEGVLRVPVMTSFYAHETFPPNWHRHPSPVTVDILGEAMGEVGSADGPAPGAKDSTGNYIPDHRPDGPCLLYNSLVAVVPASLLGESSTVQIKANTRQMLEVMKVTIGRGCPDAIPRGN
jgi:hypothetical protein